MSQVPWYRSISDAEERSRVMEFRNEDFECLDGERLLVVGKQWTRNDESVRFEIEKDNQLVLVRPLWIAIRVHSDGSSHLYTSILPIDETTEIPFLQKSAPQVVLTADWSFENADRSSGAWRNYFVGLSGDLGYDWRDTLFPTWLFHEERHIREIASFVELGWFLADPTKERIESHHANILALNRTERWGKNFTYKLLANRWGRHALVQNDIRI